MDRTLPDIVERAIAGMGASREEATWLSSAAVPMTALTEHAERIRQRFHGDEAVFCGIVNARSGMCSSDCHFCAQSVHATTAAPCHPLLAVEAMVADARRLAAAGVHCFGIITSGPAATHAEVGIVVEAVRRIRRETDVEVSVSLGMQSTENLRRLRDAGITRYHHNLETSRAFFPRICTTHSWDARLATLRRAQALGIELCSGGLFGLGEGWADRIDLGLILRDLGIGSVPLNFLTPIPGTPMADRTPLSADEALRIVAVYRFLLPDATLRICGGRPITLGERQGEVFRAGANALMTGNYLTTPGQAPESDAELVGASGLHLRKRGSPSAP
jgi:biotin synthase